MKKFLSLILTLVLVLNIFVGTGIFAFAEGGSAELGDTECTHTDGTDNYNNICDLCKEYIGTVDLVVGEQTVFATYVHADKKELVRFTPTESGNYIIWSDSDTDPYGRIYDSKINEIAASDDYDDYNFWMSVELEAGKTYYFAFGDYAGEVEYTVSIKTHVHSGGEETCMGMLCDCGDYYGETTYEHRLDTTQTCIGYQCLDCEEYFGEGNGIHEDFSDDYINICDFCDTYIGQVSIGLGENTIPVGTNTYVYVSFVPSESGTYDIYSQSEYDPAIFVYSSDFEMLVEADDVNERNFSLTIELEAEKTYYLAIYEYEFDYNLTFYVEKHEHSGVKQSCYGYLCSCGQYYGEGSDHTDGGDDFGGWCDECYAFLGTDLALGNSTVICGDYEDGEAETLKMYRFIPSEGGKYAISSVNGEDPIAYVYEMIDGAWNLLTYADDNFNLTHRDFSIVINLEAGKEYYFGFSSYDVEGEYEILFVKHAECTDTVAMCIGGYCTVCGQLVNNTVDEDVHVWTFGECNLCYESIPEDYAHEHEWDDGDCKICGDDHDCKVSDWDEDGYCTVCEEDAGFKIIRDGKVTYYRGLTAVIEAMQDGDLVVMLEDRYISADYTIDADITFDLNGYALYFDYEEDIFLNVYGDVTFVNNSSDAVGYIDVYMIVYGDVTFVSGGYNYIELYNGKSFADVIPGCSDVYQNFGSGDNLVDISEYTSNNAYYFYIYPNDDSHVAGDYGVLKEATCETNAIEGACCIYCAQLLDAREIEGTAGHDWSGKYRITKGATCHDNAIETLYCLDCGEVLDEREVKGTAGHLWSGNYREGTKTCDVCHETIGDEVYSEEPAREFVRELYEWLKELLGDEVRKYFQALLDTFM
ncbi:MAG: hypothetical protein IKA84_01940 [Clostridia bacterium]|nr:hypothetical protein [Clostridia bacterium]